MRLVQATVRSYRLHHETSVGFDPARTLIGGPNEAGKSTFAEALHRALFLKAKGNTNEHRAMVSTIHPGQPEVSLTFETGGTTWKLTKRFGSNGTTTLTPSGRPALTGEAAETELAGLLAVEAGLSGKSALTQWSHLWAWQHQSADDPTGHATSQKDSLLQRLQTLGGAAALQSELDTRTAAAIAEKFEEIYTKTLKPKAGSDLALAELACEAAEAAETAAAARATALESAASTWRQATASLATHTASAATLIAQKTEAERRQALIRLHQQEETSQAHADTAASLQCRTMEDNETALTKIRQQLTSLESALAPLNEATATRTATALSATAAADDATRASESSSDAAALARQQHDLASARLQEHQSGAALAALTERSAQAAVHQNALESLRQELAALPPVDPKALSALEKLSSVVQSAEASLTAMAAGLEILAASGPVLLGGESLVPGDTRILTEETELSLGGSYQIRIRPGGGLSLAEARAAARQANADFRAALEKLAVGSLDEAATAAARRTDLTSRQRSATAALDSLQATDLTTQLAAAAAAHTAARAEAARRAVAFPGSPPPATLDGARTALAECVAKLSTAEATAAQRKTQRDAVSRAAAEAAAALHQHQQSLTERQTALTGIRAKLEYFLETHGHDPARAARLELARSHRDVSAAALATTREALSKLQPEQNALALQRLERSLTELQRQQSEAETARAVAADQLRSDGSNDPAAALAHATAQAAAAHEQLQRLRRHAEAIALLHQTFTTQQQALADRFTEPLADRISGYLECLFGPGTRATVSYEKQEFTRLALYRPTVSGGALEFENLSGGTREQTAAAVRLAMAEVLAAGHGGTLPIVFDDAFTHSDPVRLQQLQNMLDLAATRGLQVILLTCTPADYAGFGAATINL